MGGGGALWGASFPRSAACWQSKGSSLAGPAVCVWVAEAGMAQLREAAGVAGGTGAAGRGRPQHSAGGPAEKPAWRSATGPHKAMEDEGLRPEPAGCPEPTGRLALPVVPSYSTCKLSLERKHWQLPPVLGDYEPCLIFAFFSCCILTHLVFTSQSGMRPPHFSQVCLVPVLIWLVSCFKGLNTRPFFSP